MEANPGCGVEPDGRPPAIVIVETFEETRGWPVRVGGGELPGEPLSMLRIVRMLFSPWLAWCEWPRLLLRSARAADSRPQR